MKDMLNECKRCGICCTKGGPALHRKDLPLIKSGKIPRSRLITIRVGELVYKPFSETPQAANCELIKICGTGRDWQCYYFDSQEKGCRIYDNRPITCSILQCWDTTEIEKHVEKDTISRFDLLRQDEPMYNIVKEHESLCPCPDMQAIANTIEKGSGLVSGPYEWLVNKDIEIRTRVVDQYGISLAEELFFFGRPIFQLLQQLGVKVTESAGKLRLQWPMPDLS